MLAPLGDLCRFLNGGTPSKAVPAYFEGNIPWITGADVVSSVVDSARSYITHKAIEDSATNLVDAGTVLLVTRTGVGKVARAAMSLCFSQDITALIPKSKKLDSQYLVRFLQAQEEHLKRLARGATIKGITREVVESLSIPLPPIEEQRRIAAILDQAEALRAKRHQALAKLDTLTQSLFLEMFGDPRWNPQKWKIERLAELGVVSGGLQLTPRRCTLPLSIPYLRVANVYRDKIDLTEVKTMGVTEAELMRTALQTGDLLIVEGHGNPEEIGRSAVWNGQIETCVHQNHLIRVRFNPGMIDPLFASTYLNSKSGREQVLKSGKTTSGLNTLSTTNVKSFRLFAPPMSKQKEFRDAAMRLRKELVSQQAHSSTLDSLSSSLQRRAFRGEL